MLVITVCRGRINHVVYILFSSPCLSEISSKGRCIYIFLNDKFHCFLINKDLFFNKKLIEKYLACYTFGINNVFVAQMPCVL